MQYVSYLLYSTVRRLDWQSTIPFLTMNEWIISSLKYISRPIIIVLVSELESIIGSVRISLYHRYESLLWLLFS